jgi:hypothetical protein
MPFSSKELYQSFERMYCFHLQDQRVNRESHWQKFRQQTELDAVCSSSVWGMQAN